MIRKNTVSQVLAAVLTLAIMAAMALPLVQVNNSVASIDGNAERYQPSTLIASNPSGGGNGGG